MAILGLDVSTSCTGICVLDNADIVLIDRIEFKGCRTFWEKCDRVEGSLLQVVEMMCARQGVNGNPPITENTVVQSQIDRVVLEEPLMGFRPGMSSAQTISMLLRFNGIVSGLARKAFGVDPEYISANHARKVCGVRLQRTSVAGKSQKEQVFDHMAANDLKGVAWPTKKDGATPVDWSRDATDAYVIARAASLEPPPVILPPPLKKSRNRRTG